MFSVNMTAMLQEEDIVRKAGFSWLGIDWGRRGGLQARELALWVQLQREFHRRGLLSSDAIKRLGAIGFTWKAKVCIRFAHVYALQPTWTLSSLHHSCSKSCIFLR